MEFKILSTSTIGVFILLFVIWFNDLYPVVLPHIMSVHMKIWSWQNKKLVGRPKRAVFWRQKYFLIIFLYFILSQSIKTKDKFKPIREMKVYGIKDIVCLDDFHILLKTNFGPFLNRSLWLKLHLRASSSLNTLTRGPSWNSWWSRSEKSSPQTRPWPEFISPREVRVPRSD